MHGGKEHILLNFLRRNQRKGKQIHLKRWRERNNGKADQRESVQRKKTPRNAMFFFSPPPPPPYFSRQFFRRPFHGLSRLKHSANSPSNKTLFQQRALTSASSASFVPLKGSICFSATFQREGKVKPRYINQWLNRDGIGRGECFSNFRRTEF